MNAWKIRNEINEMMNNDGIEEEEAVELFVEGCERSDIDITEDEVWDALRDTAGENEPPTKQEIREAWTPAIKNLAQAVAEGKERMDDAIVDLVADVEFGKFGCVESKDTTTHQQITVDVADLIQEEIVKAQ